MAVFGLSPSEALIFIPPIVPALVRAEFARLLFRGLNDDAAAAGTYRHSFFLPVQFDGFIRQAMPGAVGLHGGFS